MDIFSAIKIEEIYRYNLKSLVDISKFLGTWESLTVEKKHELIELDKPIHEKKFNLTQQQIIEKLNDPSFWEEYNDKYVYGEITKSGVNKLANYLKPFTGNFYDIGSGNGKLLIHLSIITNFEKYTGIEIVEPRHQYALKINEVIGQPVNFIRADVLDVDISDGDFIFLDDLMFPTDLRKKILKKLPKCYYLTAWQNNIDEFIENWSIGVAWLETEMDFYLYKKR